MPKFTIRFHKDTHDWADVEVEAANPKEAAQMALDCDVNPDDGDWEPCGDYGDEEIAYVIDEQTDELHLFRDLFPADQANAKLIAAAPDLLAALQHVYAVATQIWGNNPHDSCLHEAAAAIEKATK